MKMGQTTEINDSDVKRNENRENKNQNEERYDVQDRYISSLPFCEKKKDQFRFNYLHYFTFFTKKTLSFNFPLNPCSNRQQQSLLPKASGSTARQIREYIPRSGMKKYNQALSNLIPVRYKEYVSWLNA